MIKNLVILEPFGELGNRLYRLGNVLAFAKEFGLSVFDLSFCEGGYSHLFAETYHRALLKFPKAPQLPFSAYPIQKKTYLFSQKLLSAGLWKPLIIENEDYEYNLSIAELNKYNRSTICLKGFFFQADEYVIKHGDYLRTFFRPLPSTRAFVDESFNKCKTNADIVVGVHIRHGDFEDWCDGRFYFSTHDYSNIMEQTVNIFRDKKIHFILFSNAEGLDLSCFADFKFDFQKRTMDQDLFLMAKCDYIVAPDTSTFSGLASFLGQVPIYRINDKNKIINESDFVVLNVLNNFAVDTDVGTPSTNEH